MRRIGFTKAGLDQDGNITAEVSDPAQIDRDRLGPIHT